jgi:hypothetical protein
MDIVQQVVLLLGIVELKVCTKGNSKATHMELYINFQNLVGNWVSTIAFL